MRDLRLPVMIKITESNEEDNIAQGVRVDIDSVWYYYDTILNPIVAKFHDVKYLRDYLKDVENSLSFFNPNKYKHPEIKKGLQALSEEYQKNAELVRERIKELEHEEREIS